MIKPKMKRARMSELFVILKYLLAQTLTAGKFFPTICVIICCKIHELKNAFCLASESFVLLRKFEQLSIKHH